METTTRVSSDRIADETIEAMNILDIHIEKLTEARNRLGQIQPYRAGTAARDATRTGVLLAKGQIMLARMDLRQQETILDDLYTDLRREAEDGEWEFSHDPVWGFTATRSDGTEYGCFKSEDEARAFVQTREEGRG